MTHYDLHFGALDALSRATGQKTVKTACGVRVPMSKVIASGVCECAQCRQAIRRSIVDTLELAAQDFGGGVAGEARATLARAARDLAAQFGVAL